MSGTAGPPPPSRAPAAPPPLSPLTVEGRQARGLRPGWPLSVIFLGFPLWWATGFSAFIFLIMSVPMVLELWRRGAVRVPRGFAMWLLFLVWMLLGVLMLFVDAPYGVPGSEPNRILVFAYRAAWYFAITVVLLYVGNLTEKELPTERVVRLLSFMFVVTVGGGLLGVVLPHLEFPSLLELALPKSLSRNDLVASLIHPKAATSTTFLGYEESRPIAPFAYANSWGANLALFLPFFLLAHSRGSRRRRLLLPVVLLLCLWPVIYSLNRGLWGVLGLGTAYMTFRFARKGNKWALRLAVGGAVALLLVFAGSPLRTLFEQRLDTPHSNERRGQLYEVTVASTLIGSPVVGFGSTRDLQGSFASVGGGERPGCKGCGVPPLGTQGSLWFLIFSHGTVGAGLFLGFMVRRFAAHWRDPDRVAIAGCCVLLSFAVFLLIYDLLDVPLYTVMIALALMWRRERMEVAER
ncbi:hypothetical protein [Planomonospora sp. ID82291]|uniref:hypothetical protein n=1 Tax=Planomonospora sp. ID82291 TaxID=2738136 RepID=UPI001E3B458A|nr:hypothetical protein [Planomonospora sp. ID82291]